MCAGAVWSGTRCHPQRMQWACTSGCLEEPGNLARAFLALSKWTVDLCECGGGAYWYHFCGDCAESFKGELTRLQIRFVGIRSRPHAKASECCVS